MRFKRRSRLITLVIILTTTAILAYLRLIPFWTRSRLENEFGIKLPPSSEEIRFDVRSTPSSFEQCAFARIRLFKSDYAKLVNDMYLNYNSVPYTTKGESDWKIYLFEATDWWTRSTHIPPDSAAKYTLVNDETTEVITKYEDGYMYLMKCVSNQHGDVRE